MLNHISKLSLFFVLTIAMIVTSCDKEGVDELTENFTADTELSTERAKKGDRNNRGGNKGNRGGTCFDLVYPLSISFPDGTTAEIADKEAAKTAKKAWKEANPDATERPSIVFPYDVQLQDDSVVTIDSEEALATLRETCGSDRGGDRGNRGDRENRGDRGNKCFMPVYPITIVLPDGTTANIADKAAKKAAIQAWKEANPDAERGTRATIGFPLTVELADETQTTLNSQEELDALKVTCSLEVEETGGN